MKIHIVFGTSGAYEDYMSWPVKAFADHEQADIFAKKAKKKADKNKSKYDMKMEQAKKNNTEYPEWITGNSLDSNAKNFEDTDYYVTEVNYVQKH